MCYLMIRLASVIGVRSATPPFFLSSGRRSKRPEPKVFQISFNVKVKDLELFNETKDSAAVTLPDLTHDAKRLAPFDVAEPPRAGVGGKDGGGVFV